MTEQTTDAVPTIMTKWAIECAYARVWQAVRTGETRRRDDERGGQDRAAAPGAGWQSGAVSTLYDRLHASRRDDHAQDQPTLTYDDR